MPDIKNQFTGGKMNKDVDERLVPKGEYRDAMNIQVSTSEGSDVGTVQNILGNTNVSLPFSISNEATCVGSIADEKNDALYWFVREPDVRFCGGGGVCYANPTIELVRDIIFQYKDQAILPVFVDIKGATIGVTLATPSSGDIIINSQEGFDAISVGDTLTLNIDTCATFIKTYTVLSKNTTTSTINIGDYSSGCWASSSSTDVQIFLNKPGVLKFPDKIITGINIIDDMLFWTDGVTEPKKINIPRSIEGNGINPDGLNYTRLIIPDNNIDWSNNIPVQEKHITVIRKSPLKPPTLSKLTSIREGITSGITGNLNFANNSNELFDEGDSILMDVDDGDIAPNFKVGDTLRLIEEGIGLLPPENYTARVVIINKYSGPTGYKRYRVTISTLSDENPIGSIVYAVALEEEGHELFQRKFPRFAYRYKYTDNEYSAIGPFSEVAFIPGHFRYHPTEAYNMGMVNNLKELTLQDFIPSNIPKDVVQVDLLYKNETNPNIYVVKSVTKDDTAWNASGSHPNSYGSYNIVTENIYAQLPSNQLLRHWDNVPKNAVSQEVTGNRIVYGNYTQGYDYSPQKTSYSPEIEASIEIRLNQGKGGIGQKSIKSLRTYDFGIVYGDEYGRETPVLTASSATQIVPKSHSENSTSISISLDDNPPLWADYCKVFVKETSNEYYNLAVDRIFDAEDGNVWLSFPSVDRNKVDEDTYLVLKKGVDNSEAVLEEARYKIVAIENEAPDYIKTNYTLVSEPNQFINGYNLFGGKSGAVDSPAEAPEVGHTSFTLNKNIWSNPYSTAVGSTTGLTDQTMGLVNLETLMSEIGGDNLYVVFSARVRDNITKVFGVWVSDYTKRVSGKYLVTGISPVDASGASTGYAGKAMYKVSLAKAIPQSDSWLTKYLDEDYGDGGQLKPHFYRQRVINNPEFDGRFFVKIIEDKVVREKIKPAESVSLDWKVVAYNKLYHLIDHAVGVGPNSTSVTGNTGGVGAAPAGYGASTTKTHWKNNLKFGGDDVQSRWFIDHTFYAGIQPGDNDSVLNSVWEGNDPSLFPSFNGSIKWIDDTYYATHTPTQIAGYLITGGTEIGWGIAKVHSDGLFTHPTTTTSHPDYGALYFHLSYSQLVTEPQDPLTDPVDEWTVGNDNEDKPNTHTDDQTEFVSNLKAGKYFRIKGNDTVYIITGAYNERLYNYMGAILQPPGVNDVQIGLIGEMTSHYNKRLRWTIKYEIYGTGDALATNDKFEEIDNDTAGTLEFVEPFIVEEPNTISPNPTIFETEPKEDVDLDIYYETANSIPLELTPTNREQFIPPGAIIDFKETPITQFWNIPEDLHVVRWEGKNTVIFSPELTLPQWGQVNANPIKFVRSDGSWVEAIASYQGNPGTFTANGIIGFSIDYFTKNIGLAWFNCWSFNNGVESNRVGDTYNKPFIINGVKVSTSLLDEYEEEHRKYGLIYSGLYNSTSGVNNLNQFIAAEKITKDINPMYGSIQKLHAGWGQGGDLVALCEDRILKILANKDALYNADGNTNITSTNRVLGTATPYSGEYGISKNPESFASEAYRIYFTDKVRGTVMRLSRDGLTPISMHGMKDWFRDNLKLSNTLVGSYDDKKDEYNVTLTQTTEQIPKTVTFREDVKGWVSFKSFVPENAISCANEYFTFDKGKIWKHHDESVGRNTFYNVHNSTHWSTLNVILNDIPGSVKSFSTINYEGSQSKVKPFLSETTDDYGNTIPSTTDNQYYNLAAKPGWHVDSVFTNKESGSLEEFIEKEGKWFNYIKGKNVQTFTEGGLTHISMNDDNSSSFDQASFAIQGLGILGGTPDPGVVYGCMDSTMFGYNPNATASDGSCIPIIYGCMEASADNECLSCNTPDGSCLWSGCCCESFNYPNGCTNQDPFTEAYIYMSTWTNVNAIVCGSCTPTVSGCMDSSMFNYNPNATSDDGSCVVFVYGCEESSASNYGSTVNTDDGSCEWWGCIYSTATNYLYSPNNDGTNYIAWPSEALNYTSGQGMYDDGSCTYTAGCTDSFADNYDSSAVVDDGSCTYCTEWEAGGSFGFPNMGSNVSITHVTYAGISPTNDGTISIDFPSNATVSDVAGMYLLNGSGIYNTSVGSSSFFQPIYGSTILPHVYTGLEAGNYYVKLLQGNAQMVGNQAQPCECDSFIQDPTNPMVVNPGINPNGCIDSLACNYNANAIIDDGSCEYPGCDDIQATNGDPNLAGCGCVSGNQSCCDYAPIPVFGCMDSSACNFDCGDNANPSSTTPCNDGVTQQSAGSCDFSCIGCMDNRPIMAGSSLNYAADAGDNDTYCPTCTIHDQSMCEYNFSYDTIFPGNMSANNFVGNSSGTPGSEEGNWSSSEYSAGVTRAYAVFDVSQAPPIRFPWMDENGASTTSGTNANQWTSFSWERNGFTSSNTQGDAGDIDNFIANQTWEYSIDDGITWLDGANYTFGDVVKLVRFYYLVNSNKSSGDLNWGTYPYGFDGKFKQRVAFAFTDFQHSGVNYTVSAVNGTNDNDFTNKHSITSESPTITTGCIHAGYCNTSGSGSNPAGANWPTSSTSNPCAGIVGCMIGAACNYNPNADCHSTSACNFTTHPYWYWGPNNTCGGAVSTGCYTHNNCAPGTGTCHGTIAYLSLSHCQNANCSGALGCMDSSACNYDSNAQCDDGSCSYPQQCQGGSPGYDCVTSGMPPPGYGCVQAPGGCGGCGTYTNNFSNNYNGYNECVANCP